MSDRAGRLTRPVRRKIWFPTWSVELQVVVGGDPEKIGAAFATKEDFNLVGRAPTHETTDGFVLTCDNSRILMWLSQLPWKDLETTSHEAVHVARAVLEAREAFFEEVEATLVGAVVREVIAAYRPKTKTKTMNRRTAS